MTNRVGIRYVAGVLFAAQFVFGPGGAQAAEPTDAQKSIKVVLYAAAEPQPALKYQLLPPFIERRPGNAAVWWNRLPAGRPALFADFNKAGGDWEKIQKWLDIPLGDPREKEARPKVIAGDRVFADIERAARFESCDWELPIRDGNVIEMLIPEVQQTRQVAQLISAQARLEIARGDYEHAVQTLQNGFALARDVAKGPTLIHALVGTAIASMMVERIREMAQQPDSPNLYWAVSTLPQPLIDFRPGYEAETRMLTLQFPELADLETNRLAPDQWRGVLVKLVGLLNQVGSGAPKDNAVIEAATTGLALRGYPQARQFLLDQGRSAAAVDAMPVAQAILIYAIRTSDRLSDDHFKWLYLPYTEAAQGMERASRKLQVTDAIFDSSEVIPIARMLLPAVMNVKKSETKLIWNVAQLRILEALRLYAHAHGQLPDRLSEISDVPIPRNPFDGKSFTYHRDGEGALLGCEEAGPAGMPWRCEITLASKRK